jgi:hypothetical protein
VSDFDENPLNAEILAEKATAYFATIKKMEAALAALQAFDHSKTAATPTALTGVRRREELLAEAGEIVWFFIIQREAMKLPYYEELFAEFEIPDEVRNHMGPNRGKTRS